MWSGLDPSPHDTIRKRGCTHAQEPREIPLRQRPAADTGRRRRNDQPGDPGPPAEQRIRGAVRLGRPGDPGDHARQQRHAVPGTAGPADARAVRYGRAARRQGGPGPGAHPGDRAHLGPERGDREPGHRRHRFHSQALSPAGRDHGPRASDHRALRGPTDHPVHRARSPHRALQPGILLPVRRAVRPAPPGYRHGRPRGGHQPLPHDQRALRQDLRRRGAPARGRAAAGDGGRLRRHRVPQGGGYLHGLLPPPGGLPRYPGQRRPGAQRGGARQQPHPAAHGRVFPGGQGYRHRAPVRPRQERLGYRAQQLFPHHRPV